MRLAWIVAIAADLVQFVALPFFAEGWVSPFDDALELLVSMALVRLLGWHPALLPALVAELLPGVDLVPAWTVAVAYVAWTRREGRTPAPPSGSSAEVVGEDAPPPAPPPALPRG
jgi:hypothetical protein